jgi:tetratricopeptide (TPR) repeat protein
LAIVLAAVSAIAADAPLPAVDRYQAKLHHLRAPFFPEEGNPRVFGAVVLQVNIGRDGHVTNVIPVSGRPELVSVAKKMVQRSTYVPFLIKGTAAEVTTTVEVTFSLVSQESDLESKLARRVKDCKNALSHDAPASTNEAVTLCKAAADIADIRLDGENRPIAYTYYAAALLRDKQYAQAARAGEKAIDSLPREANAAASNAYVITAHAKYMIGDAAGADKDMDLAEIEQRKILNDASHRSQRPEHLATLNSMIQFHARVLTVLGKPADAQKKLHEANQL